jgi:hypothetical protein
MKRTLAWIFASLTLAGCQSAHSVGHALGGIETTDIQQAKYLKAELPAYLGLPDDKIRVEPGSGVSHVTVDGVSASGGKQALISKLHDFEVNNPKLNPIKLLVFPEDDSIWSKPTLIER